ncbi:MAG TPA: ABC transporter substrate-binding protein [Rhizomicrobium sp.]|nr:ABC transporter substrate-binding protein [Rhizomicrobium sp.]
MGELFARLSAACVLLFFYTSGSVAAPQHIVSTFLCTDEYVFRLVPRDRIAALSFEAGDRHPVVSTIADKVGGIAEIHPTTETVLDLHPDLVVMYQGTMPRLHQNLAALGVPVLDVPWANSVADIRKTTRWLGAKLGAQDRAAALLDAMDAKLDAARRMAKEPPVRTLLYEPNGYASTGGVTDELMTLAGLSNASPNMHPTRAGTIPVEMVVAASPELLIFSSESEAPASQAELIQHHPAFAALAGRTLSVRASLISLACPGPWSADMALTFAELAAKARALAKAGTHN